MGTAVSNQVMGLLITVITLGILTLVTVLSKAISKPNKKKVLSWSLIAIASAILVSVIESFFLQHAVGHGLQWKAFILTIIAVPIFEELLHRRLLFQILIDAKKFSWKLTITAFSAALALWLVPWFFSVIGWISDIPTYLPSIFFLLIYGSIITFHFLPLRSSKHIQTGLAFIGQAVIFTSTHHPPSVSNLIGGFLFAALYYLSGRIGPPIIAHAITNLYVNFI